PPQPYSFSYDNTDEFGTRIAHEENADANNARVGSYSYSDATGITRTVRYTADATGFHATVETNEPGTKSSAPADVQYSSSAVEGPAPVPRFREALGHQTDLTIPAEGNVVHGRSIMFSKVLIFCIFAFVAAQKDVDGPPRPYNFNYDNTDEFGTRQTHEETGDENNNKVGSYSYTDPTGVQRTVRYTADATGFHVVVETNEPGTETHYPADAQIISSAAKVAPPPNPPRAQARPVAVHAVHAAPVAVHAVHAVHTPVTLHAVHSTPVTLHAVHAAPFTLHAAPISYATAHHVTPIFSHAPLTYTLGRAKSR
ncbi:unnamed protein product, partial [Ixodes hexagonus]